MTFKEIFTGVGEIFDITIQIIFSHWMIYVPFCIVAFIVINWLVIAPIRNKSE